MTFKPNKHWVEVMCCGTYPMQHLDDFEMVQNVNLVQMYITCVTSLQSFVASI